MAHSWRWHILHRHVITCWEMADPLALLCMVFTFESVEYGSLYVTLCFVLWRFDFGVLTFDFHILSFLFCVLCTMLFILNGAIHEVETRYRRKDGRKRSCKYFNAFIVHVMLVGFFTFEIHAAGTCNYQKVKNIQVMLQSGFSLCESIQIDPG